MGISHFWAQADAVAVSVAILLALLSLLSWSIIGQRFFRQLQTNRSLEHALEAFWAAPNLEAAVVAINASDRSGIFSGMARTAAQVVQAQSRNSGIGAGVSHSEILTRALRNNMVQAQAGLESGLTFLASVGSTAPFIGLFGTVWGIYHALVGLAGATQVVLDKVAGPVGEAL
ncbi:MAG: hypothetical protein RIR00_151, partial [Pseudomonadota bacterium]